MEAGPTTWWEAATRARSRLRPWYLSLLDHVGFGGFSASRGLCAKGGATRCGREAQARCLAPKPDLI